MPKVLIAFVAVLLSVLLWGLLTQRWSAKSRLSRQRSRDAAQVPLLMRIPVPWVFVLIYLVGVVLNLVVPITIHSAEILSIGRVAGIAIIALGLLVAFSARNLFRKSNTTTVPFETPAKFVTSGPFRISRNPMYVGLALIYVGVAHTQGQVWPLLLFPGVLGYIDRVVIPVEEGRLLEVFGDEYRRYCARVRRWL
ncbi:MAG TPA: isoprenylcysteine carboxylmethyltransferase family protein [Thermoanaerobaculia bacterium]|jgi:protein-S-isoprenylcysteine O-methyltransferase Ste14|nr:isoprenylcysteine carboxylmethyltransferase family protein [Thermoanaerobaculia bacterium]